MRDPNRNDSIYGSGWGRCRGKGRCTNSGRNADRSNGCGRSSGEAVWAEIWFKAEVQGDIRGKFR